MAMAFVVLSASLYGCGKAEGGQETESVVSADETAGTETKSDGEPETEQAVELEEDQAVAFPENFSETIGNVTFNMDIVVDTDLTDSIVTAKAQMQKVNREKAFQLFFGDIPTYDTYDYEEEDEYGETVHQVTYVDRKSVV